MFYVEMCYRNSTAVKKALLKMIQKHHLKIDSLTIDNGSENYKLNEIDCIRKIYHCHPYNSSEKSGLENCHRLLRRHFLKGISIDKYVGQDLTPVMNYANNYYRNKLQDTANFENSLIFHNTLIEEQ